LLLPAPYSTHGAQTDMHAQRQCIHEKERGRTEHEGKKGRRRRRMEKREVEGTRSQRGQHKTKWKKVKREAVEQNQ